MAVVTVPSSFTSVRVSSERVPFVSKAVASSDLVDVTVFDRPCSSISTYTVPIIVGVMSWVLASV